MTEALITFLSSVLLLLVLFAWTFRPLFKSVLNNAVENGKTYSTAYVKASCLILITMGNTFKETFQPLTVEMVRGFAWWDWVIKLGAPILAGLAVLVAFLDRSMQKGDEIKAAKDGLSKPPFPPTPTP